MMQMPNTTDALESLRALHEATAWVADQKTEFVIAARHQDKTWAQIGEALGMSRQSAYERYGAIANRALLAAIPDEVDRAFAAAEMMSNIILRKGERA